MTKSNAAIVREIFHLFAAGKAHEAMAFYHEDVVLIAWGSVLGGTYRGHEGLLDLAQRVGASIPGRPRFDVLSVVESANTILVEIEGRTATSTGRAERWRTAEVFELRHGKVVAVRLYTDTEAIASRRASLA